MHDSSWVVGLMNFFLKLGLLYKIGNMKPATQHWLNQRLTSVVLIPLTFLFLFPLVSHMHLDHSEVIKIYENPVRSIVALSFLTIAVVHFKQGTEVVIEDYIHDKKTMKLMLLINNFLRWALIFSLLYAFVTIIFFN